VGTDFILDLALGNDISPTWGVGFHWDRQWANTQATDQGVDGKLNLGADFFMARGYWRPLRSPGWNLGLAAGIGPFFSRGDAKVERGSTNYGDRNLSGNGWALDGAVLVGVKLSAKSELQIQGGYRSAKMDKLEVDGRTLTKEDGSDVAADYSGFQVKVGMKWSFGE
jgi:hypothetical protein